MKKITHLLLIPASAMLLSGCSFLPNLIPGGNSSSNSEPSSSISYTPEEIDDPTPVIVNTPLYDTFWRHSSEVTMSITMSQDAANFMNNYQSNHDDSTYFDYYVPCTVVIHVNSETYTFEEAGIREKGNMSRRNCLDGGHFSLNSLVHYKISFKETFDDDEYTSIPELTPFYKEWDDSDAKKERKNRRLFDMEKIDIKWNRNDDQTKSKQSYAYSIFEQQGVLCGKSTLANVSLAINGDSPITATYEVLECIDSVFIKRHFNLARSDGDLYKCTYTDRGPANFSSSYQVNNQIGVEKNKNGYHPVYDLKTNKKKNTTHTNLLNLITAINNKSASAEDYKQNISKLLDMEEFIMYESVAFLMGNFDDFRNNANNYYLYFESATNYAHIIPYDFDRCLGMGQEGRQEYMTSFSPESTKMQCNGQWQTTNLFWRTICSSNDSESGHQNVERIEDYRAMYQKNIEDMLNNHVISVESFTAFVNDFPTTYKGNPNGSGSGNTTFENYFNKKVATIKSYYSGVTI